MENIAIAIVDTYKNKEMAKLAIEQSMQFKKINNVYIFSDEAFYTGAIFVEIPEITSITQYSDILLNLVPKKIDENLLVVQWDGFVLNPKEWLNCYFDYDYIGAPHYLGNKGYAEVGNGGFSYRSRRLLNALSELNVDIDPLSSKPQIEDVIICSNKRKELEEMSIKFATVEIAKQFSYQQGEYDINPEKIFGFHGPQNFPNFFNEGALLELLPNIIPRINNLITITMFLESCKHNKMDYLFQKTLKLVNSYPDMVKKIDQALTFESGNLWTKKFISLLKV